MAVRNVCPTYLARCIGNIDFADKSGEIKSSEYSGRCQNVSHCAAAAHLSSYRNSLSNKMLWINTELACGPPGGGTQQRLLIYFVAGDSLPA